MAFTLEALRAKHGDSLLLHYGDADDPKLIVIDGGPRGVFRSFLEPRLDELARERDVDQLPVEILMVSHIDDDHVAGVLDLTKKLRREDDAGDPPSYDIRALWHNSFDDIVGDHAGTLESAARDGISTASTTEEVPESVRRAHPGALVLASVRQGRQLRDDAETLGLRVNAGDGEPFVARGGDADRHELDGGLTLHLLGPLQEELDAFQEEWDRELARLGVAQPSAVQAAAYADDSAFNLASLVVLVSAGDGDDARTMLLTGDARGDHVLRGLERAGLMDADGEIHVDLLKIPHHGSDRNVETGFFRRVRADHYVVSGDGRHHNPELAMFQMIFAARDKDDEIHLHLTYAPDETIDAYDGDALQALFDAELAAGRRLTVHTPQGGLDRVTVELP
jgi:hypothetical protein